MAEQIHCCGIIVFYENETVVVKTARDNYSYPKGKKERGETHLETAYRELKEETNIDESDIILYPDEVCIDERKGQNKNISVRYFIGKLKTKVPVSFQDPDELDEVSYMKVSDVLSMPNENMKLRRKQILEEAYNIFQTRLLPNGERHLSKSLSWLLRHGIVKEHMTMTDTGYVLIADILAKTTFRGYTTDHIIQVVNNNDKQRFNIKDDIYIRARQGHSEEVGALLDDEKMLPIITEPLEICYHGTTRKAMKNIAQSGLKSMDRKHIHLATSLDRIRQTSKVAIKINMELAMVNGIKFYRSDNDVILCRQDLDTKYFMHTTYL